MTNWGIPIRVLLVGFSSIYNRGLKAEFENHSDWGIVEVVDNLNCLKNENNIVDIVICSKEIEGESIINFSKSSRKVPIVVFLERCDLPKIADLLRSGVKSIVLEYDEPSTIVCAIQVAMASNLFLSPRIIIEIIQTINDTKLIDTNIKNVLELSQRESDVTKLVMRGYSNAQIAQELNISIRTTRFHVSNIMKKLGVTNRTATAIKAFASLYENTSKPY